MEYNNNHKHSNLIIWNKTVLSLIIYIREIRRENNLFIKSNFRIKVILYILIIKVWIIKENTFRRDLEVV